MIVEEKMRKKQHKDKHYIKDQKAKINEVNKFFTFRIADEIYGIHIGSITEIIEMRKISYESNMPDFVKGVITLKKKIIPLIDLRLRFKMKEREYDDRTSIIIVKINEFEIGFIVDTILEIANIINREIIPISKIKTMTGYKKRFMSGIGKIGEDVKIILDINKIVQREDIERISQR